MQDQLNGIKYTSTIVPDDIRKNMFMKKVLVFVQAKEEHPELTKPQLCKMIAISDSIFKRIMKDLNMKSFYRYEVLVNKILKVLIRYHRLDIAPITNYDDMLSDYSMINSLAFLA